MKAKILRVIDIWILQALKPGLHTYKCSETLPEDAKITGIYAPFEYPHEVWFRIESEMFPEVKPGSALPFLDDILMKVIGGHL